MLHPKLSFYNGYFYRTKFICSFLMPGQLSVYCWQNKHKGEQAVHREVAVSQQGCSQHTALPLQPGTHPVLRQGQVAQCRAVRHCAPPEHCGQQEQEPSEGRQRTRGTAQHTAVMPFLFLQIIGYRPGAGVPVNVDCKVQVLLCPSDPLPLSHSQELGTAASLYSPHPESALQAAQGEGAAPTQCIWFIPFLQ